MQSMTPKKAKEALGLRPQGRLSKCPDLPNCVCSEYAEDREHFTDALPISGDHTRVKAKLLELIAQLKGAHLVENRENYLRVEMTSAIFRFVDDLEFRIDSKAKLIHLRSASRLGRSDLGANGRRVRKVHKLWQTI